ncbi:oxidoreductase [Plectosphaerella plurivora]|uniref:Oxidoreductase n=1 Tax=Plectosphaerella plurivora TaxID=936078 RepID=A0A9P8UZX7_9PEZI|nr:oxidoreductase [Plectosphaerella plurivora]
MSRPWIFITPASRGIGAALTTHLLRTTPLPILATARRSPSSVRETLLAGAGVPRDAEDRLHVVELDVTSERSVAEAAARAKELFPPDANHLQLGLAIPGILHPEKSPDQVDYEKALETFKVNALGPLVLMKHFYGFLPKNATKLAAAGEGETTQKKGSEGKERELSMPAEDSKSAYGGHEQPPPVEGQAQESGSGSDYITLPTHATWLAMSARVGSVSDNRAGGWYSYRSSKSAVTQLAKSLDNYLRTRSGDKAIAVAYHPGTVKTDLSKEFWDGVPKDRLLEVDDAAEKLVNVVCGLKKGDRGRFWDWNGKEIQP